MQKRVNNQCNKNNNEKTNKGKLTEKPTDFEGFHYDDKRKSKLKTIKMFMTWDELWAVERAFFTLDRFGKADVDNREDVQKDIRKVWRRLCREMDRKQPKKTKQVEIEISENGMDLIEDLFFAEMSDKEREEHFEKTKRIYLELCKAGKRKREIVELGRNEKVGMALHAVLEKDNIGKSEGHCINILEVPGAASQGDTKEEAIDMVKEALELILEEMGK